MLEGRKAWRRRAAAFVGWALGLEAPREPGPRAAVRGEDDSYQGLQKVHIVLGLAVVIWVFWCVGVVETHGESGRRRGSQVPSILSRRSSDHGFESSSVHGDWDATGWAKKNIVTG
jgi:hypothetical protein